MLWRRCCDLAPLKRRRMPVMKALDLCAAILWLTHPFAEANPPNPFAETNHPNPFAEANHPSLSAVGAHPFAELAVDAFSARTSLVLSGPNSVWNPITVNHGGVEFVELNSGDNKVRNFFVGEMAYNSSMSWLIHDLRDLQVHATREALGCDQGWGNQESKSRYRHTKDNKSLTRECERLGETTADLELPAFIVGERTGGAVRCRVPRQFLKQAAYAEPTPEVLHWLAMRPINIEPMSKDQKGEDRRNNPMKGVYHHSLERRWYAQHPTTKKYRHNASVDSTMRWASGETVDLEAEDDFDAGNPEPNEDNQDVIGVDNSEDVA
ncbi:hypothetical protein N9L68_07965 [bacterium]|nr:hypothetical protein [bacterium]